MNCCNWSFVLICLVCFYQVKVHFSAALLSSLLRSNTVVFGLAENILLEKERALFRRTEVSCVLQLVQSVCEHLFHILLELTFIFSC